MLFFLHMGLKALKSSLVYFYKQYTRFGIPDKAATLAFRALFAFAPILILIVSLGRFFLVETGVEDNIALFLTTHFGPAAEGFLERILTETADRTVNATVVLVSFLLVVYGASGFILSLQSSFLDIFSVDLKNSDVQQKRLTEFYTLAAAYLLLFLVFITAFFFVRMFIGAGVGFVESITPLDINLFSFRFMIEVAFLAMTSGFFALTYRIFGKGRITWKDASIGALFSAITLTVLNNLLGLYFSFSYTIVLYGAASFFVALLFWLYYFSVIIFLGALLARISSNAPVTENVDRNVTTRDQ